MKVRIIKGICEYPKGHGIPLEDVRAKFKEREQHERTISSMIDCQNEAKQKGKFIHAGGITR